MHLIEAYFQIIGLQIWFCVEQGSFLLQYNALGIGALTWDRAEKHLIQFSSLRKFWLSLSAAAACLWDMLEQQWECMSKLL